MTMRLVATVTRLLRDKRAVTALEYGMIAVLIIVVIITAVTSVGTNLSGVFHTIATTI
jgi:pilus assembly protein Flp/PilA